MEKKRLKIAFLSKYVGTVNRGVETYVLELSERLKKDFDVEILTGEDAGSFGKMVSGKYDVIFATNGRMQALKASVARWFSKHKLIISGQAGVGRDDWWNIFVVRPDVYVALTDFEMHWAKKWANNVKLIKIPNGVDLEKFNSVGTKINLNVEAPVVLSVGALYWYKHHDLTIKAVSMLPKCSLVIIGAGPEKQKLTELGNRLLGKDRFKILEIAHNELPKYYRSAKMFVLPSWNREAFGIVYLEAMASNLPVVAPNDATRSEIIGDAGILVDVNNIDTYANAIERCLNMSWGQKPRIQANKFSWDNVAIDYKNLIEGLYK